MCYGAVHALQTTKTLLVAEVGAMPYSFGVSVQPPLAMHRERREVREQHSPGNVRLEHLLKQVLRIAAWPL